MAEGRGQHLLEQDQQRRAERAADQRADAADDHRDQHVAGDEPAHQIGRDEIDVLHLECAGERRDRAGGREGGEPVEEDAPAERGDADRVLPDGGKRAPERRGHDQFEQQPDDDADDDHRQREGAGIVEIDADRGQVEPRDAAHAVGAVEHAVLRKPQA